jgi:BED zinc finger
MMASGSSEKTQSDVISFAYVDYKVNPISKIASANCRKCKAVIKEKQGTTSAFVRHLSTSAHTNLRQE